MPFAFEARGTPNVTYAMTSALVRGRSCDQCFICLLPTIHNGKCLIAKRYVCAAKPSEALLNILVVQLANLPNATCVCVQRVSDSRD